jgi:hypothetical protein
MPTVPRLSDDPAVAAAEAKLNELKADLAQSERDRDAASATGGDTQMSDRDRAARALLGDEAPASTISSADELTAKIQTLRRAIEIQTGIYENAISAASRAIAESLRPEYEKIVRRGAKALTALRQFIIDEKVFRDELTAAGLRFTTAIRPMGLPRFDETDVDAWQREAREFYSI